MPRARSGLYRIGTALGESKNLQDRRTQSMQLTVGIRDGDRSQIDREELEWEHKMGVSA